MRGDTTRASQETGDRGGNLSRGGHASANPRSFRPVEPAVVASRGQRPPADFLPVEAGQGGGRCRDCGQRIYWATRGRRRVPVDCGPAPRVAPTADAMGWGSPHYLTCQPAPAGQGRALPGGAQLRPRFSDADTTRPVRSLELPTLPADRAALARAKAAKAQAVQRKRAWQDAERRGRG